MAANPADLACTACEHAARDHGIALCWVDMCDCTGWAGQPWYDRVQPYVDAYGIDYVVDALEEASRE